MYDGGKTLRYKSLKKLREGGRALKGPIRPPKMLTYVTATPMSCYLDSVKNNESIGIENVFMTEKPADYMSPLSFRPLVHSGRDLFLTPGKSVSFEEVLYVAILEPARCR